MKHPNLFRASTVSACLFSYTWVLADTFPTDIETSRFSNSEVTPCPACLCVSAEGEVFAADESLCESALRAATDRLPRLKNTSLPLAPFTQILQIGTPRQRAAATVALGRLGNPEAAATLLEIPFVKPSDEQLSHASPNSSILLPHLAAHALTRLQAADACLAAIGTPSEPN